MSFAISGGHPVTVRAAEEVLRSGGNAVDAAVAAFWASWVAEPCMTSAGGGGFALVFEAATGETLLFDGFCQTPIHKRPAHELDFVPVEVDFGGNREIFHTGPGATATPGAVALACALHERYGTLPLTELAQPAIQAATEGVEIDPFQYYNFQLLEPILRRDERAASLFFPTDQLIRPGEVMRLPGMADFLDYLAREGRNAFYRGEIARNIATDFSGQGGHLTEEDLANYQVLLRQPLSGRHRDHVLFTNPYPSLGGMLISLAFQRLTQDVRRGVHHLSRDYLKRQYQLWLELEKEDNSPESLRRQLHKANDEKRGSTTHINIVDRDNNAVSLSSSNGEGAGYFIKHTDIQLNNMLGEAALLPAGFHSWQEDVRLSSLMAPTLVLAPDGIPQVVLGSGGAGRIASVITQVLHLLLDHGLPVAEAVRAPRVHLAHGEFNVEAGFAEALKPDEINSRLVEWSDTSLYFGGVHALARRGKQWAAAGDPRRNGVGRTG